MIDDRNEELLRVEARIVTCERRLKELSPLAERLDDRGADPSVTTELVKETLAELRDLEELRARLGVLSR